MTPSRNDERGNNGDDPSSRDDRARFLRAERREARTARINVISLFERLGYDLSNSDDITRLDNNLRYTEKRRRLSERLENNRIGWLVSVFMVILGAGITAVAQWVKGH